MTYSLSVGCEGLKKNGSEADFSLFVASFRSYQEFHETVIPQGFASLEKNIRNLIRENLTRRIVGTFSDHVHENLDSSFDTNGYSGVRGAVCNSSSTLMAFCRVELSRPRTFGWNEMYG